MGAVGTPHDNAMVESFWGRMQVELLNRKRWKTRLELATAIQHYVENFHNHTRRHSALDMLTPTEYENRYQSTTTAWFQHPESTKPGADQSVRQSASTPKTSRTNDQE